nr:histone H3-K9 methyltransferase, WIYLD domain protein [Tanacetum cinerariifolium]
MASSKANQKKTKKACTSLKHLGISAIKRFDNEEPDFNLLHKSDEEEIEPLRKKPRSQNRPLSLAGSSRTKKVQHDFNLSDNEEIEAKSQNTSPVKKHENKDYKGNKDKDEDENVTPCSSEVDIVSPSNVMKQLEEKYQENFQGLGVEFNLSNLLKEIRECFMEQWNVSDGSNQSLVQTFENIMKPEKQCGPERDKVFADLTPEENKRFKADIRAMNILLQVTHQPQFADNTHIDSGFTPTDDLIENLTKPVALLAQSYKTHLPQTNNQLRTSSNTRNQAIVQNGRVVVQNIQ